MKKILLSFIFTLLGLGSFAQSFTIDSSFAPNFNIRNSPNTSINNIVEASISKLLIQGNFRLLHNNAVKKGIFSVSSNGNVVSNFSVLNGFDFSNILIKINSNKFYFGVGSNNGKLIDSTGSDINLTWQTNFFKTVQCFQGTPYFYPDASSNFPNGSNINGLPCPIETLPDTFPGRHLIKVKPDGLWDSTFAAFPNYQPSGVIRYDSARLLVYGSPSQFTHYNGVRVNGLCRIFHDGSLDTTFSSFMADTNAFSAFVPQILDSTGKVFLTGRFFIHPFGSQYKTLARLNANGSLDFTFNTGSGPFSFGSNFYNTNTIVKTSDGGYLVGGHFNRYQGQVKNNIAKIDSFGNVEPQYFTSLGPDSAYNNGLPAVTKILKSKFGGYYVAGNFLKWDGQASQPIVKITGLNGGIPVGLNENSPRGKPSGKVSVFPNPTSGMITIESEAVPAAGRVEIRSVEVYGLMGTSIQFKLYPEFFEPNSKSIEGHNLNHSVSTKKSTINLTNFSKGVYFLKVELENGEVVTKKMVKQ